MPIYYRNWKGKQIWRTQWLLVAWDFGKRAIRTFAVKDIGFWE